MKNEEIVDELIQLKNIAKENPIFDNIIRITQPGKVEYVKASKRQRAYFRRRPYTRDDPGPGQAAHRVKFATTAAENRGKKGKFKMLDGREISRTAALLGDKLRIDTIKDTKENEKERLMRILEPKEILIKRVQRAWI